MPSPRSRPTIRQIARICGVSAMTVSAALNNKPGQMSVATRERVLKVVREMGYRPTPARWEPHVRETLTLGVIAGIASSSLVTPNYYNAILNGFLLAADQLDHNITIFTSHLLKMDPHRSIRIYCDDRCDGLLIVAPLIGDELVKALRERGFPFVIIGDPGDYEDISCIDIDNVAETYKLMDYLIRQGHRRILYIGGDDRIRSSRMRQEGYRKAFAAHNLQVDETLILRDIVNVELCRSLIYTMLSRPADERPTAIFGWHDDVAELAIRVSQELGLKVPGDVSVAGFNDIILDRTMEAFLTTVRQPYYQISKRAIEMLQDQVRGTTTERHRVYLPCELVLRQSVSPR